MRSAESGARTRRGSGSGGRGDGSTARTASSISGTSGRDAVLRTSGGTEPAAGDHRSSAGERLDHDQPNGSGQSIRQHRGSREVVLLAVAELAHVLHERVAKRSDLALVVGPIGRIDLGAMRSRPARTCLVGMIDPSRAVRPRKAR
jgi:hypothetical protein